MPESSEDNSIAFEDTRVSKAKTKPVVDMFNCSLTHTATENSEQGADASIWVRIESRLSMVCAPVLGEQRRCCARYIARIVPTLRWPRFFTTQVLHSLATCNL